MINIGKPVQDQTMATPQEGEKAPEFSLKDEKGKVHKLSDYKGKKVILYFYPKDDTPGCTRQACDFSNSLQEFEKKNTIILGVSPDDEESHRIFIEKYKIPYTLLCDTNHSASEKYGVWGTKTFMGVTSVGLTRSTFLIDENGKILKSFYKVSPEAHHKMLLTHL